MASLERPPQFLAVAVAVEFSFLLLINDDGNVYNFSLTATLTTHLLWRPWRWSGREALCVRGKNCGDLHLAVWALRGVSEAAQDKSRHPRWILKGGWVYFNALMLIFISFLQRAGMSVQILRWELTSTIVSSRVVQADQSSGTACCLHFLRCAPHSLLDTGKMSIYMHIYMHRYYHFDPFFRAFGTLENIGKLFYYRFIFLHCWFVDDTSSLTSANSLVKPAN